MSDTHCRKVQKRLFETCQLEVSWHKVEDFLRLHEWVTKTLARRVTSHNRWRTWWQVTFCSHSLVSWWRGRGCCCCWGRRQKMYLSRPDKRVITIVLQSSFVVVLETVDDVTRSDEWVVRVVENVTTLVDIDDVIGSPNRKCDAIRRWWFFDHKISFPFVALGWMSVAHSWSYPSKVSVISYVECSKKLDRFKFVQK